MKLSSRQLLNQTISPTWPLDGGTSSRLRHDGLRRITSVLKWPLIVSVWGLSYGHPKSQRRFLFDDPKDVCTKIHGVASRVWGRELY